MTILNMSLGGALLIAVILLLRRLALYRLPKWTFVLLWAVALCRLLAPFAVPSPVSVYTGAARAVQLLEKSKEAPAEPVETLPPPGTFPTITCPGPSWEDDWTISAASLPTPVPEREPVSLLTAAYLTGAALCGLFFAAAYLWSLRRFREAEPAESEFLRRWQEEHPILFPVTIRTCAAVNAPMAYGLVRPVVLLPGNTDWSDEDQLTCVLTHEYVHIRRGDLLWKLLLTVALCVHWFNPLVWAMYLRANQDLELACDERVVRILGLENRKGYAYSLLAAAESGFSPFCLAYTTRHHMEERIRAIMKIKKKSAATILTAALLVTSITAVFATSKAPLPRNIEELPQAVMSNAVPTPAPDQKPDFAPDASADAVPEPPVVAPDPSADAVPEPPVVASDASADAVPEPPIMAPDASADAVPEPPVVAPDPSADAIPEPPIMAPDASAAVVPEPPIAAPDASGTVNRVHPITGEPAVSPAAVPDPQEIQEPAESTPENRWGVPDGEIPWLTSFTVDSFEDAHELGKYLEATHGLYPGDYVPFRDLNGTHYGVTITYDERAVRERLPDGVYPVNSKGETYGRAIDSIVVGYEPDLIQVLAANGETGYAFKRDLSYGGYPGEINTSDDALAYMEWLETQPDPISIPVYDENRDTIIGYFNIDRGLSEEEVARELETLKPGGF